MNVIRIPTKFSKSIKRLSEKDRLLLFDLIIKIGDDEIINAPDSMVGDLVNLIYTEWMNMESRNGTKPTFNHISEGPGTIAPSDPGRIVEYNIVEYNKVKDNIISTIVDTKQVSVVEEEFGKDEINIMQKFLRQAVGVSVFKDSKERWYVTHCYNLMKKIGKQEFQYRLKEILSDPFKAKNSNKLAYLYGEIKSYIHSPVIEEKKPKVLIF